MKRSLSLILVLALVVIAFGHASTARAESAVNSEPATAAYINGLPQSIAANSSRWFKFDYVGDRSQITVLMPNGANTLVAFNVFTPAEAQNWWESKPVGRGTAYQIDCETGEENYLGECQSNDLKWVGEFNAPGTYFVQVVNYNTGTANFTLTIQGTGVSVGPAPAPAQPAATTKTTSTQQTSPLLPVTGGIWKDAPLPFQHWFTPVRE